MHRDLLEVVILGIRKHLLLPIIMIDIMREFSENYIVPSLVSTDFI